MSYTGHSGRAEVTTRGSHRDTGVRAFSLGRTLVVFAVIIGWVLFAVAALTNPGILDDVWISVGGLPMAGQIVAWTIGLPWMLSIVVVKSDWSDIVRLSLVSGIAVLSIMTFLPSRS